MRANYAGGVSLIDEQIGRLLAVIEQRGERDNTVIVFTSDHGEMNGDYGLIYKANFQDPAIQIPLIVAGAGVGRTCDALVELMDVGATLTDYAGADYPPRGNGISLRPAVEGEPYEGRPQAISEFGGHLCMIDQRLKCELNASLEPVLAFEREDRDEVFDVRRVPEFRAALEERSAAARRFIADTPPRAAVRFEP